MAAVHQATLPQMGDGWSGNTQQLIEQQWIEQQWQLQHAIQQNLQSSQYNESTQPYHNGQQYYNGQQQNEQDYYNGQMHQNGPQFNDGQQYHNGQSYHDSQQYHNGQQYQDGHNVPPTPNLVYVQDGTTYFATNATPLVSYPLGFPGNGHRVGVNPESAESNAYNVAFADGVAASVQEAEARFPVMREQIMEQGIRAGWDRCEKAAMERMEQVMGELLSRAMDKAMKYGWEAGRGEATAGRTARSDATSREATQETVVGVPQAEPEIAVQRNFQEDSQVVAALLNRARQAEATIVATQRTLVSTEQSNEQLVAERERNQQTINNMATRATSAESEVQRLRQQASRGAIDAEAAHQDRISHLERQVSEADARATGWATHLDNTSTREAAQQQQIRDLTAALEAAAQQAVHDRERLEELRQAQDSAVQDARREAAEPLVDQMVASDRRAEDAEATARSLKPQLARSKGAAQLLQKLQQQAQEANQQLRRERDSATQDLKTQTERSQAEFSKAQEASQHAVAAYSELQVERDQAPLEAAQEKELAETQSLKLKAFEKHAQQQAKASNSANNRNRLPVPSLLDLLKQQKPFDKQEIQALLERTDLPQTKATKEDYEEYFGNRLVDPKPLGRDDFLRTLFREDFNENKATVAKYLQMQLSDLLDDREVKLEELEYLLSRPELQRSGELRNVLFRASTSGEPTEPVSQDDMASSGRMEQESTTPATDQLVLSSHLLGNSAPLSSSTLPLRETTSNTGLFGPTSTQGPLPAPSEDISLAFSALTTVEHATSTEAEWKALLPEVSRMNRGAWDTLKKAWGVNPSAAPSEASSSGKSQSAAAYQKAQRTFTPYDSSTRKPPVGKSNASLTGGQTAPFKQSSTSAVGAELNGLKKKSHQSKRKTTRTSPGRKEASSSTSALGSVPVQGVSTREKGLGNPYGGELRE